MVVLLRLTACSTPASQFSMVASLRSQSSLEMLPASLGSSTAIAATGCAVSFTLIGLTTACFAHCARPSCAPPVSAEILRISGHGNCKEAIFALENGIFRRGILRAPAPPQFSMVVPLRSQARLWHSLLHWAYFALFRPQGARFVRPPPLPPPQPVSAEILRISGRGNCRETIFALENGIFRRGVLRAPAPLNSAWSSHTFAPPCANACAVFRPCGLRFAPCPRGSSRFAASDARRLACGTPCFIGLTPACFAHCARPSCAPAVHAAGDD